MEMKVNTSLQSLKLGVRALSDKVWMPLAPNTDTYTKH